LMDRSYLSDQAVVSASRAFICVRLVTYEDADEMEFMKSTYLFRTPTKNSLFAILDPTAREHLVAPGRSMKNTFKDAAEMARRMKEISREYPRAKKSAPSKLGLPYLKDVRVAMNVAACDAQRLLVLYAESKAERKKLETLLLPLAWNADLMGKLLFATTSDVKDLARIEGHSETAGLMVIEPDAYGLEARQVAFVKLGTKTADALRTLIEAAEANEVGSKDSRRHIGKGRREGVHWEHAVKDEGSSRRRGRSPEDR